MSSETALMNQPKESLAKRVLSGIRAKARAKEQGEEMIGTIASAILPLGVGTAINYAAPEWKYMDKGQMVPTIGVVGVASLVAGMAVGGATGAILRDGAKGALGAGSYLLSEKLAQAIKG